MVLGLHSCKSRILKARVMFLCSDGMLAVFVCVLVRWMVRVPVLWWCSGCSDW